jgi:hypothetical protein
LWIHSGKIVEVNQTKLKNNLTALLRYLAPFVRGEPWSVSDMGIFRQLTPGPRSKPNRWHHIDMPKANLRVLESPAGPFHKAECSVCGEKFYVPPDARDFKMDMLKQFDAHLFNPAGIIEDSPATVGRNRTTSQR